MNSEVEKILKQNIKWKNKDRLKNHTIKHPIKEIENNENWKGVLDLSYIAKDENDYNYKETERRYEKKSKEILDDEDAVGYFHNGINNDGTPYYSIGLFHNDNSKMLLITYIQRVNKYRNSRPYIATCFFRKIDFSSKFYYAYQILENPNAFFAYNLSKEDLLKKFNIELDFNLKEVYKLVDSSVADDKIDNIYAYYFNNKTITTEHYMKLKLEFKNNIYFEEIEKINKKIEEYESIIKNLEENYIDTSYEKFLYLENKEIIKILKEKYKNDELLKIYLSKIVDISLEKVKLGLLKNENYIKKCIITRRLIVVDNYLEKHDDIDNNLIIEYLDYEGIYKNEAKVLYGFIVKIKEKIKQLEKHKNNVINELSMDDELLFELGLVKNLASKYPDYIKSSFDYPNEFKNEYDEILKKYI